jgi:hypothetical protein
MPPPLNPNDAEPISKDGMFAATCGTFSTTTILQTIADDTRDIDSISTERSNPDSDDLADADALYASMHDQLRDDETPIPQHNQTEVSEDGDQADTVDSESMSTVEAVEVEHFPFGRPGAPIPGRAQSPSGYDSQATSMGSLWAPFRSQLDWDVARWAKLRGPSSMAVSELLAIPGVCMFNYL